MGDDKITEVCKKTFQKKSYVGACSGYLRDVAKKLKEENIIAEKLPLVNADGLMDYFKNNWDAISSGPAAIKLRKKGVFVVVGLKSRDHAPRKKPVTHGHVGIVSQESIDGSKYPLVFCGGSGDGYSQGTRKVRGVWTEEDAKNVKYYAPKGTLQKMKKEMEEANGRN